jgi:hypothetical protein
LVLVRSFAIKLSFAELARRCENVSAYSLR